VVAFIKGYQANGISYSIVTDIEKDGMLLGPAFELYGEILSEIKPIKLIASGGITTIDDVIKLSEMGCEGAIIGKAIYEGTINLKELMKISC
jgi:phosphoribosylformimino-5-aminoimidazole carboxamide ribotide isomerase